MERGQIKPVSRLRAKYVAILVLIVVFGMILSMSFSRLPWQADLTGEGLYTLSETTKKTIASLDDNIIIFYVYSPGDKGETLANLINAYSCEKIKPVAIDPSGYAPENENAPEELSELTYGSAAVYGVKKGILRTITPQELFYTDSDGDTFFNAERKLTSAIKYVTTGKEKYIGLTYEHREKDKSEYYELLAELDRRNVPVRAFDLLSDEINVSEMPLIISVCPRQDFSEEELLRLEEYVKGGGRFLLLADAKEYDEEKGELTKIDVETNDLKAFFADNGIISGDEIIYDRGETGGMRPSVVELHSLKNDGGRYVFYECSPISCGKNTSILLETFATAATESADGPFTVMASAPLGEGEIIFASSSSLLTMSSGLDNASVIYGICSDCGFEEGGPIEAKPLDATPLKINHGIIKIALAVLFIAVIPAAAITTGVYLMKKRKEKENG